MYRMRIMLYFCSMCSRVCMKSNENAGDTHSLSYIGIYCKLIPD